VSRAILVEAKVTSRSIEAEAHRVFTNLSRTFWKGAVERAVKTAIQVFVALLSAGNFGLLSAPWSSALSTAGMAALLSLLTSVISEPVGQRQSPSVVASTPAGQPSAEGVPHRDGPRARPVRTGALPEL
jgi:hypothetical protein